MLPTDFIHRIQSQFNDASALIEAIQKPAITSIRLHPQKNNATYSDSVKWSSKGYFLEERPVFTLDPNFHAGAYYVQESSSMFLEFVFNSLFENKDLKILDLCAAPGGKSTLIASWLNGDGLLVSNEIIKNRFSILNENITKWGYANTWLTNVSPIFYNGIEEFFDVIVIDSPCSGEGLFRKDANAVKEWSIANCEICETRQKEIVSSVLPSLNTGGYIIYSTCTFNPKENDEQIDYLINHYPLELVEIDSSAFPEITNTVFGKAFLPHRVKGEGFYISVLKKVNETPSSFDLKSQRIKWNKPTKNELGIINSFVRDNSVEMIFQQENIIGIPEKHIEDFYYLSQYTKVTTPLEIGVLKGKDFIPSPNLAFQFKLDIQIPTLDVDKEQALNFLGKRNLAIDSTNIGWNLVRYEKNGLGFIKCMQNRVNNYYPNEWKIRMDF